MVGFPDLELDEHDVIWAEGAASETFVDDDSRGMFQNASEFGRLYPEAVRVPALYCAPRLQDGYALEAIRRGVAERAGLMTPAPERGPLRGFLDHADGQDVRGWAQNLAS